MKQEPISLADMLDRLSDELESSVTSIYSYEPHPKQKVFHCSRLEEKLFIGGNRSGKTVANVIECIWWLTKTHPFREDVRNIQGEVRGRLVCVSFIEGLEKIILPLFKKWVPRKYLIDRSWDKSYINKTRTLTLNNGSFIEFQSYDQELEKFAGTSRHFVSFDEEPPMVVWQECLMRLIDTDGSWWISMTPVEGLTWIFEDIYKPSEEGLRPDTLVLEVSMHDNPHLTEKAKRKVLGNIANDEDRMAREEGKFAEIGGRVYKTFDKRIHMRPADFIPNSSMRIYTSIDTGYRHPAAWLWHAVYPDGRIVTFHEIIKAEQTIDMMAKQVIEYEKSFLKPRGLEVYVRTGDPALKQTREITGTSVLQEYANHGIFIGVEGIPHGPGSVDIGVIKVTQYLNTIIERNGHKVPMWQVTEDCTTLIKQMGSLRWEKYASKKMEYENAPKPTIHKKDDDGPDSLRYFMTMMDDLTPERMEAIQNHIAPVASSQYYDPRVIIEPEEPRSSYNIYEGSILYGLEG